MAQQPEMILTLNRRITPEESVQLRKAWRDDLSRIPYGRRFKALLDELGLVVTIVESGDGLAIAE